MSEIYIPPVDEDGMAYLPEIEPDVFEALEREHILNPDAAFATVQVEIDEADQAAALQVGFHFVNFELDSQKNERLEEPDTAAIERYLTLAYGGLLRQRDKQLEAAQKTAALFGMTEEEIREKSLFPTLPPVRTLSVHDDPKVSRLRAVVAAYSDTQILERTHRLADNRGGFMAQLIDGRLERPLDELDDMAARTGVIGMWGVLNALAYDLTRSI